MAFNFPSTPTINQVFNVNGIKWQWDGTSWKSLKPSGVIETDPVFSASAASGITSTNISNWNTAYGWGNHASSNYIADSDFTVVGLMKRDATSGTYSVITDNSTSWNSTSTTVTNNSANWTTAYSAVNTNAANWTTAYNWGNHALAGYLTGIGSLSINALSDVDTATVAPTNGQTLVWNTASNAWKPGAGSSSGEFNTQITNSIQYAPLSFEGNAFSFPSTAGKRYVIDSINVSNVASANVEVNIIVSISNAVEKTYIAYNVPIASGGAIELLKQPIVANPSDVIKVWSTNASYVGTSGITEMYISYSAFDSTDYFGTYASTVSIPTASLTTIHTSSGTPSVLQSIHLTNRTDSGDYPVSVAIVNGATTTYLVKDLILPRYSAVEILDRPKRIETGSLVAVKVGQTSTIDVVISGKKITG